MMGMDVLASSLLLLYSFARHQLVKQSFSNDPAPLNFANCNEYAWNAQSDREYIRLLGYAAKRIQRSRRSPKSCFRASRSAPPLYSIPFQQRHRHHSRGCKGPPRRLYLQGLTNVPPAPRSRLYGINYSCIVCKIPNSVEVHRSAAISTACSLAHARPANPPSQGLHNGASFRVWNVRAPFADGTRCPRASDNSLRKCGGMRGECDLEG